MGIFKEIPPTAGIPLYAKDLLSAVAGALPAGSLEDDIKNYLRTGYCRIVNSGTTALYLILETLKKISGKKTVVIPSYICALVPLAIARSGLKIEVCDVTGDDFNFAPDELERICAGNKEILAIVAAHIGGVPVRLNAVKEAAARCGAFLIEDCAQSFGVRHQGRYAGTSGDFSFFSLARGKGLTIYEGGALVTNNKEFETKLDDTIARLVKKEAFSESVKIAELFGYWLFYRPQAFWFVYRLPYVFWVMAGDRVRANQDRFDAGFPVNKVSAFRQAVGHAGFYRIEDAIRDQRKKAGYFFGKLMGVKGVRLVRESPGDFATYPFVTILFEKAERRGEVLSALQGAGLGASVIYSEAVTDFGYLKGIVPDRRAQGGRSLAARSLALSTSTYLDAKDMDAVVRIIKEGSGC
ncbi:MAG: DegT/DnrJ/EryC1/StrS family aminotransferase [Candidatus Omnitrophota bacterium]